MPIDTSFHSLIAILSSPHMLMLLFVGVCIGLIFGILPGLGGKLGLVFLIPFTIGMDPLAGALFLIAMHSVVHTSGAIPSILFGIPGTGPDAATIVDGYPMARNGEAGRALGATLFASGVGGVIGALFLSLFLPFGQVLVLAFGSGEYFLLAVLGITFIASLSGRDIVKGLIVGMFGLMLSFVRLDPITAEPRYTYGQPFLWDGIDPVTAVIGIFAIPEIIEMGSGRSSVSFRALAAMSPPGSAMAMRCSLRRRPSVSARVRSRASSLLKPPTTRKKAARSCRRSISAYRAAAAWRS